MEYSRRSVLKFGTGLAALGSVRGAAEGRPAGTKHSGSDPWVELHAGNLIHNVREVHRRVGSRPILAVIKNNGYGAGLVEVAKLLDPLSQVAGLAVVKLQEAVALRDAGISKPILLMGPFEERELEQVVNLGIMPMVYTSVGPWFEKIASKRQQRTPVHICVDTGIGRVGVPYTRAAKLIRELADLDSVQIRGTMMTFTEDPDFDREQLRRFEKLAQTLTSDGISLGRLHAASSFALFQRPDAFLDMVRPGMALFGVYPDQQLSGSADLELRPAISFRTRVIYVKRLEKGESAGYNRAYSAGSPTWVATLPVGHSDGLPRDAVKGAKVRIGTRLYPFIATVSASHSIVEIGREPEAKVGDIATVFDWLAGSRPEDVSTACGASVYDLTMHLNPLLPRKVV